MTSTGCTRPSANDLPFALTRLIGTEPDLYSAIDRQNAEGEFRAAVSLPLATPACVIAVTSQPAVLLLSAIPGTLFRLGLRRRRDALLTLAHALYTGRVWSLVLGGPLPGPPQTQTPTNAPDDDRRGEPSL